MEGFEEGFVKGGVVDGSPCGLGEFGTDVGSPSGAEIGSVSGITVNRRTGSPMFAMLRAFRWLFESVVELRYEGGGECLLDDFVFAHRLRLML